MKNIINNLCQLISLRILAILGYLVPIAVLYWGGLSTIVNGENEKIFIAIVLFFFITVYWVLGSKVYIILIITMLFEYCIRKSNFKENNVSNAKTWFFYNRSNS